MAIRSRCTAMSTSSTTRSPSPLPTSSAPASRSSRRPGCRRTLFRPPYGRFSAASHAACLGAGLTPVYWSGWGCDWEPVPAERIADLVVRDLMPGTIVLLHDSPRYAYRDSAEPTVAALALILAAARERGLEPAGL